MDQHSVADAAPIRGLAESEALFDRRDDRGEDPDDRGAPAFAISVDYAQGQVANPTGLIVREPNKPQREIPARFARITGLDVALDERLTSLRDGLFAFAPANLRRVSAPTSRRQ